MAVDEDTSLSGSFDTTSIKAEMVVEIEFTAPTRSPTECDIKIMINTAEIESTGDLAFGSDRPKHVPYS